MKRVSFDNILAEVCDAVGWDANNLDSDEFGRAKRAIASALEEAHRATWWFDLIVVERRQYEADWSTATSYAVGEFVYYPGSDAYYQCVKAHSGHAPATDSGSGWETELAYWAEAARDFTADQYDASTTYAAGDMATYTDGNAYQCHTASTGNAPTDTAYWGLLTPWIPAIPTSAAGRLAVGDMEGMFKADPRVWRLPERIAFERCSAGFVPLQTTITSRPWVRYLPIAHALDGEAFDATETYSAVADEDRSA